MMRIKKYAYEIYAVILATVFFEIVVYWATEDSMARWLRSALPVVFAVDCVLLYFTLRKLWRTKWRKRVVSTAQRIIAKIAKRLMSFIEKRNIKKNRKTTVLSGRTRISFDLPIPESDEKKPKKAPRWKQLQDNRERLGYLYKKLIEHKIKHGSPVYSSETPSEIKLKGENEAVENEIYDLYIANRYRETVEADTEALGNLRNELLGIRK